MPQVRLPWRHPEFRRILDGVPADGDALNEPRAASKARLRKLKQLAAAADESEREQYFVQMGHLADHLGMAHEAAEAFFARGAPQSAMMRLANATGSFASWSKKGSSPVTLALRTADFRALAPLAPALPELLVKMTPSETVLQDAVVAGLGSASLLAPGGVRKTSPAELVQILGLCLRSPALQLTPAAVEQCLMAIASKPELFPRLTEALETWRIMGSRAASDGKWMAPLGPHRWAAIILAAIRALASKLLTGKLTFGADANVLTSSYTLLGLIDAATDASSGSSSYRNQLTSLVIDAKLLSGKLAFGPDVYLLSIKEKYGTLTPDERLAPWFRRLLCAAIEEANRNVPAAPAPLPLEPAPLPPLKGYAIQVELGTQSSLGSVIACGCSPCKAAKDFLQSQTEIQKTFTGERCVHGGHLHTVLTAAAKRPKVPADANFRVTAISSKATRVNGKLHVVKDVPGAKSAAELQARASSDRARALQRAEQVRARDVAIASRAVELAKVAALQELEERLVQLLEERTRHTRPSAIRVSVLATRWRPWPRPDALRRRRGKRK